MGLAFAFKLEDFGFSTIVWEVEDKKEKPTKEEVLAYAKPLLKLFISKHAQNIPYEQKEEIEQSGYLRLLMSYDGIDADAGWKSYVYNHCRGAVLDYLKFGKGFAEEKWSISKEEEFGAVHAGKIHQRVFNSTSEDDEVDIDHVLGSNGVFSIGGFDGIKIKWDLVARMARQDIAILALAKWIRGFSMDEIGSVIGLSRARAGQLIVECLSHFTVDSELTKDALMQALGLADEVAEQSSLIEMDSVISKPAISDPWLRQAAYAFGLCRVIGIPDEDQSHVFKMQIGWNLEPVDLDSETAKVVEKEIETQLGLFDG